MFVFGGASLSPEPSVQTCEPPSAGAQDVALKWKKVNNCTFFFFNEPPDKTGMWGHDLWLLSHAPK